MKLGIVISTRETETVWNAFRVANHALGQNDMVTVFLIGAGVEAKDCANKYFNPREEMRLFLEKKGKLLACTTCLKSRNIAEMNLAPYNTLGDLHSMLKDADKVLTF